MEIGLTESLLDSIRELKDPSSEGNRDEDIIRVAEERLPTTLGTRYTQCALRCLRGYHEFKEAEKEGGTIGLTFAFRERVVDELKRMAVSCGYVE